MTANEETRERLTFLLRRFQRADRIAMLSRIIIRCEEELENHISKLPPDDIPDELRKKWDEAGLAIRDINRRSLELKKKYRDKLVGDADGQ